MRRWIHLSLVIACASFGCASVPSSVGAPAQLERSEIQEVIQAGPRETAQAEEEASPPPVPGLQLETNAEVNAWISYFTGKGRVKFHEFLSRGQKYRGVIEDFLVENELPAELYFLALIESGYQNHATSSARAAGVWQFMPATGRNYGLRVDREVDERRDPIRATEAAAKYLRDLHNIFGSWPLAMAAYNAGEYGIIRSILKGKSRDFWTLASMKVLPRETAAYVPKMMAAATIGADPEKYGFVIDEVAPYPELEAVEIPSRASMKAVAAIAGLSAEDLWAVNPHLRGRKAVPSRSGGYEVWFPKEHASRVTVASLASLRPYVAKASGSGSRSPAAKKPNVHRVKRGETLIRIARLYGTSPKYLMKVNNLSSGRIHAGMDLRITSRSYHPRHASRHRVRRGESLERIARRFGTDVRRLKEMNGMRSERIFPGQVLVVGKEK